MKQIFKLKNGYISNIFYLIFIFSFFSFGVFNSGQSFDWKNPFLYIGIIGIISLFVLMSNRGVVELNNGVLYRKRFFITWWSVSISSITDIFRGNMLSGGRYGGSYSSEGLTFRDVNKQFYQIPYDIEDEYNLTNAIKIIQPSVELSSKWVGAGMESNMRLKNTRMLFIFVTLVGLLLLVWHKLK